MVEELGHYVYCIKKIHVHVRMYMYMYMYICTFSFTTD